MTILFVRETKKLKVKLKCYQQLACFLSLSQEHLSYVTVDTIVRYGPLEHLYLSITRKKISSFHFTEKNLG